MEGRISLCFWSDSKQVFTIFLVPPLIHTQKTYTNLTLCIVIHILFHTSHITNDLCRTTKYYHIKQQYTAIPALLTLITPLIGRINTSARSQHTSRDRIDPPGHTPADLHPLISSPDYSINYTPPPHRSTRRSRSVPSICTTIPQPQRSRSRIIS